MIVTRTPDGQFRLACGPHELLLTRAQYEDVFYALPQDTGTLFRLLNDTVLATDDLRAVLRAMIAECGGLEKAMDALQAGVMRLEPA
ncbi:MAG: hypothetical protein HUU15_06010 [Candidatus Brocadiae bacterium]|nr:hypothetical protein [Candidatus Brocadiia bacterium]